MATIDSRNKNEKIGIDIKKEEKISLFGSSSFVDRITR